MNPGDRPEFTRNLLTMAGLYGKKLDDLLLETYWKSLKGFALEQVLLGIERSMNEEKHFPPPSVLRAKMCVREIKTYTPIDFDDHGNSEHAKLSFKLIAQITKTRMGPKKRLESFRYMAKKFPGVGWEEAVRDTEAIVAHAAK